MAISKAKWKKGRGKLGFLEPLLGNWEAVSESPMGPVQCTRTFSRILGNTYFQLIAQWKFKQGTYEEIAYYGARPDGAIGFWSFTSDGKHSEGRVADVTDLHPHAIGFEAEMPAGLARTAYWPDDDNGFHWVVEAKNKKGWKRFSHHHYVAR